MGRDRIETLSSPEETISFGSNFAAELSSNTVLALQGDLGAGKTTFVQGLLAGLGIQDTAQSPTFTYLQIYEGNPSCYHFDLYRLPSERDFILLGFEEFFTFGGITMIEWPERIASLLPPSTRLVKFSCDSPERRTIRITNWGNR